MVLELRSSLRSLIRKPLLTAHAVLILSVGIGLATCAFTVLHSLLLRPLSFPDSERLVAVWELNSENEWQRTHLTSEEFLGIKQHCRSIRSMAAVAAGPGAMRTPDGQIPVSTLLVSPDFFQVLGVQPRAGRLFGALDAGAAVADEAFWKEHFGADASEIGKEIALDGQAYPLIGVAPSRLELPNMQAGLWLSRDFKKEAEAHRLRVLARLQPGVSLQQAQAEVSGLAQSWRPLHANAGERFQIRLLPLRQELAGRHGQTLWPLQMLSAVVLLLCCLNASLLLLAEQQGREAEDAIRLALGAARHHIFLRTLAHCVWIVLPGGLIGLGLAWGGLQFVRAFGPASLTPLRDIRLDPQSVIFVAAACIATALTCAVLPFVHRLKADCQALAAASQASPPGLRKLGSGLLALQVSLALAVTAAAGLLANSLVRLEMLDLGFEPEGVSAVPVNFPEGRYPHPDLKTPLLEEWIERCAALQQAESCAAADSLPLFASPFTEEVEVEGHQSLPPHERHGVGLKFITPNYFRVMGMRIIRGRSFTAEDKRDGLRVAVINESAAKRLFPSSDPLGQILIFGDAEKGRRLSIVGVLADVRTDRVAVAPPPELYVPFRQCLRDYASAFVVARQARPGPPLDGWFRRVVSESEPDAMVIPALSMASRLSGLLSYRRFFAAGCGLLSALALFMAVSGIWSLAGYQAASRRREAGIRMALGGRRSDVIGLYLRSLLPAVLAGIGLGLAGASVFSQSLAHLLYEVSPLDPLTLLLSSLGMLACTLAGSYFPSRRAVAADPSLALRQF